MYESLKQLSDALAEAKKQVQEKGKNAIHEAFKELFAAHPALKAIRWQQYTPYFNDGEPCEFSVGEHYINAEWTKPEDSDDEDEENGPFEYPSTYRLEPEEIAIKKPVYDAVDGLFGAIPKEAMEASFGDHVQVTATREGFNVEEYSHD